MEMPVNDKETAIPSSMSPKIKMKWMEKEIKRLTISLQSQQQVCTDLNNQLTEMRNASSLKDQQIADLTDKLTKTEKMLESALADLNWSNEKNTEWLSRLFGESSEKWYIPQFLVVNSSPSQKNGNENQSSSNSSDSSTKSSSGNEKKEENIVEEFDKARTRAQLGDSSHKKSRKPYEDLLGNIQCKETVIHHSLGDKWIPGGNMVRISDFIFEEHIFHPAWVERVIHCQERALDKSRTDNEGNHIIITADCPDQLLNRSVISPSLISHFITQKYLMGIPVVRQSDELKRIGLPYSKQLMNHWLEEIFDKYLSVFVNQMWKDQSQLNHVIHMDETRMPCLELRKQGKKNGVYIHSVSGRFEEKQINLYQFRSDKKKEFVTDILGGSGEGKVLVSDGYAAYTAEEVKAENYLCNDHSRRRFDEAAGVNKGLKKYNSLVKQFGIDSREVQDYLCQPKNEGLKYCLSMLGQYSTLYRIEASLKESNALADEILKTRKEQSLSIFKKMKEETQAVKDRVPSKTKLGKAINYFLDHYDLLIKYCTNDLVEISNQRAENGFRRVAVIRKNSLFFNTISGAETGAGYLSLIQTCISNHINPEKYLTWLLELLKDGEIPMSQISSFLPYSDSLPESLAL